MKLMVQYCRSEKTGFDRGCKIPRALGGLEYCCAHCDRGLRTGESSGNSGFGPQLNKFMQTTESVNLARLQISVMEHAQEAPLRNGIVAFRQRSADDDKLRLRLLADECFDKLPCCANR